ncbi:MAG: hypothetical protein JSV35_06570 [Candidatus Bathyarchaeota archaeon]|nr:MAG: hypothetical protein JSV35_06570 [Candidatus Bathyarchaeota archaeon]
MMNVATFSVFFAIYAVSLLMLQAPLFPGSVVCRFLHVSEGLAAIAVNAFVNGVFYGGLTWLIYYIGASWIKRNLQK